MNMHHYINWRSFSEWTSLLLHCHALACDQSTAVHSAAKFYFPHWSGTIACEILLRTSLQCVLYSCKQTCLLGQGVFITGDGLTTSDQHCTHCFRFPGLVLGVLSIYQLWLLSGQQHQGISLSAGAWTAEKTLAQLLVPWPLGSFPANRTMAELSSAVDE